jgi:hypothetical protein
MTSVLQPNRLDAALGYARRGLPVFPCWPILQREPPRTDFMCGCGRASCESQGKHPLAPLVRNGLSAASKDLAQIRRWWLAWPQANVAICTGEVVVLDIDPRHGGDASLAELEHGALPSTRRTLTGGGGAHIYFQTPPNTVIRNSTGKLGPGLDIRGRGGYVMVPPSRHLSGNYYEWNGGSQRCAEMPAWLVTALQEPTIKTAAPSESWQHLVCQGVEQGERNQALARLAGHLLRRYVDPRVTLELLQSWNQTRCRPPLPPAEITNTINSIARRELLRRKSA